MQTRLDKSNMGLYSTKIPDEKIPSNNFTGVTIDGLALCGKTHLSNDFGTSEVQTCSLSQV